MPRELQTTKGVIRFPAFLPVTTFGGAFPLDEVTRPYLTRYSQALMVSHHYAQGMKRPPDVPLFVDSGGFASLFAETTIIDQGQTAALKMKDGQVIDPESVLRFQQQKAQVGATLDFVITPSMAEAERRRRQDLTIRNAFWAVQQPRQDIKLYASLQAWDAASAERILDALAPYPFDGYALGGMVPHCAVPK